MATARDEVALALATERRVVPDAIELAGDEQIGVGKSLLVRSSTPGPYVSRDVVLRPVVTKQQWQTHTDQRIGVEAELDVTEAVARRMVETRADAPISG